MEKDILENENITKERCCKNCVYFQSPPELYDDSYGKCSDPAKPVYDRDNNNRIVDYPDVHIHSFCRNWTKKQETIVGPHVVRWKLQELGRCFKDKEKIPNTKEFAELERENIIMRFLSEIGYSDIVEEYYKVIPK